MGMVRLEISRLWGGWQKRRWRGAACRLSWAGAKILGGRGGDVAATGRVLSSKSDII